MTQSKKFVATIIDHGTILTCADLFKLDIIDWNRYHAHWKNPQQCIDKVTNALRGMVYTVMEDEIARYPERNDFPGWKHTGNHEIAGKMFWNYFHHCFNGELYFGDMPDFTGKIFYGERDYCRKVYGITEAKFYGDVGKVSPITMLDISGTFGCGAMWVSVAENTSNLVILERSLEVTNKSVLALHEKLTPMLKKDGLQAHIIYGNAFIEKSGDNIYIGDEGELSCMSQSQLKSRIKLALSGKWEGNPVPYKAYDTPESNLSNQHYTAQSLWN